MTAGRDESGASAVEFALILPLLIILVFGIIHFGLIFFQYQGLQAAAREGARLAALPSTTAADTQSQVLRSVAFDATNPTNQCPPTAHRRYCVTVEWRDGAATPSYSVIGGATTACGVSDLTHDAVRVTVSTWSETLVPLVPFQSRVLAAKAEFRCENKNF